MSIDPRDLVDDALELLVLPSFSRIGYDLRRRMYDWEDVGRVSLRGRTALVTGPTSGLGRTTVSHLSAMGARVLLVGRDPDRLERTRLELEAWSGNHEVASYVADLGSLAAVRRAADEILDRESRLDILVDNAGTLVPDRRLSPDGFELSFATMVLGPFVLTSRLLPLLRAGAAADRPARIVAVTSGGMYAQRLHLDDLGFELDEYSGPLAYARAKRAQVALMREWARRLREEGIVANAMHPGWADTPGLAASLPEFREFLGPYARTAEEGVDTIVWLAASDEAARSTGRLFLDRRPRPFDRLPMTRVRASERRALWDRVVALTGEVPGLS
jgi:NAD(P)-dependent dehydrogenase (short-subunit alcohol dehydrogenase family)